MPPISDVPAALATYRSLGLEVSWRKTGDEAIAECPWCGKQKLYVNVDTGVTNCKVCTTGYNPLSFLRKLWETSYEATSPSDYDELTADRGLLGKTTLRDWGVCRSMLTGEWIVPAYDHHGKIKTLYRYTTLRGKDGKERRVLMAASGLGVGYFSTIHAVGISAIERASEVMVTEGLWDGASLYEMMRKCEGVPGGLEITSTPRFSLAEGTAFIAVPGALVWEVSWNPLLHGKRVTLLFDNDHPTKGKDGSKVEGAAYSGMRKLTQSVALSESRPESLSYLRWGVDGSTCNLTLPSGWDVRDHLTRGEKWLDRSHHLFTLLQKVKPIPEEWVSSEEIRKVRKATPRIAPVPCTSWKALVAAWSDTVKMTPGLDRGLSVMLATAASTMLIGDQIWLKVMGPPSCGKSMLCEALSIAGRYVCAESVIRGFHSGYITDATGEADHSLIKRANGKCLIVKDGDTLIQSPNWTQIMSEGRDLFDGQTRAHYRTGVVREYEDHRMSWLLCGTSSLRQMDASELGERFLSCIIMRGVELSVERDIQRIAFRNMTQNIAKEANCKAESHMDEKRLKAYQMTAGYLEHLRHNIAEQITRVFEGMTEKDEELILDCARFVSFMRARPSLKQKEVTEREFATRLTNQLGKLAGCLAVALNKKRIDGEVLRRVRLVATDSCEGRTLEIVKLVYSSKGLGMSQIAHRMGQPVKEIEEILRFMKRLRIIEEAPVDVPGIRVEERWVLTDDMRSLYKSVMRTESSGGVTTR